MVYHHVNGDNKEKLLEAWGADQTKGNRYLRAVDGLLAVMRIGDETGRFISQDEVSFAVEDLVEDLAEEAEE